MTGRVTRSIVSFAVSLVVTTSSPPATVTVFTTKSGALVDTETVRVIGGYWPPAVNASEREHVIACSEIWHVHPFPLAAFGTRPAGKLSVTVTAPFVGPLPVLETTIVRGACACEIGRASCRERV